MYWEIVLILFILLFMVIYRRSSGEKFYKYISRSVLNIYDKYAPYTFKMVREKTKQLGQEYTPRQYTIQVAIFAGGAAIVSYLYFYSLIISIFYAIIAVMFIPYLAYLRCKKFTVNLYLNKFKYIQLTLLWNLIQRSLLLNHLKA